MSLANTDPGDLHATKAGGEAAARPARTPASLADVVTALGCHSDVSAARRMQLEAGIRTFGRLLDRPIESIPALPHDLARLFASLSATTTGKSSKTLANVVSLVKAAVAAAGIGRRVRFNGKPLSPMWASLYGSLTQKQYRNGLSRFIHYANQRGVPPEGVGDLLLTEFVADLAASAAVAHVGLRHRNTAVLWNRCVRNLAAWPRTQLTEPVALRTYKNLLWEALPPSFTHDVDKYLAWLSGSDPLAEDGPERATAATTLRQRRELVRIAASNLLESGFPPDELTGLQVLVAAPNIKLALEQLLTTRGKTRFVRSVATELIAIASRWVKVDPTTLESLKAMRRRLGRDTGGMTSKNRKLIMLLEDDRVLAAFLALSDRVAAGARRSELSLARRAQQMQVAVAAAILCAIPLRLKNLANLELGKQLTRPSGADGPMHLILESAEVKNGREMHFEVPVDVARLIDEYSTYYRPKLAPGKSQYLFIHQGGQRKPEGALRDGITKAVHKHVGIHVTPHQYRHIAADLYLRANPGQYAVVQQLLGHKNIQTTLGFYAREQARDAGRLFDETLAGYRQKTRN